MGSCQSRLAPKPGVARRAVSCGRAGNACRGNGPLLSGVCLLEAAVVLNFILRPFWKILCDFYWGTLSVSKPSKVEIGKAVVPFKKLREHFNVFAKLAALAFGML